MKEILNRLKSETPILFVRIRVICISIGSTATAGYTMTDKLPQTVVDLLPYGITIGLIGTFISSLPVKNTDDIK